MERRLSPELIRFIRQWNGLSQQGFSEKIGCHRSLIGRVENGERRLTDRIEQRIRERFGLTDDILSKMISLMEVTDAS